MAIIGLLKPTAEKCESIAPDIVILLSRDVSYDRRSLRWRMPGFESIARYCNFCIS